MADKKVSVIFSAKDEFSGTLAKAERKFSDVKSAMLSWQGVATGAGAAMALFAGKQVWEAGIALQRMNNALRAATGSTEGAASGLAFVREEATRLGLDLEVSAAGFTTLAASAKGTSIEGQGVREIFTAVSEASTVLGLSASDTEGAIRAIGQVMSKGKVQAEELRGQLGERIPGAFQIAARAMGLTTAELSKQLELGNVYADNFLPKFAEELRRTYGDALPQAVSGAQQELNRFKNTIFELETEAARSGFMTGITRGISTLAETMKDEEFRVAAREVGRSIGDIAEALAKMTGSGVKQMADLSHEIRTTKQWFDLYKEGYISFWEWSATGNEEAARKMDEMLGRKINQSGVRFPLPPPPPPKKNEEDGTGTGKPKALSAIEKQVMGRTLDEAWWTEAGDKIAGYQAQLRVKLAEETPPNLGLISFDIGDHMAGVEEQRTANETRLEIDRQFLETRQMLWWAAEEQMTAMQRQQQEMRYQAAQNITGGLMNLTNALYTFSGKKSKQLFELNKVAGIADATVATYTGAAQALRSVPYPYNIAAAAMVVASGLSRVAAISSTSFGTGGGSPAAGGYGGGTPDSPIVTQPGTSQPQGPQEITIKVVGVISDATVENLVDRFNDAGSRGVRVEYIQGA